MLDTALKGMGLVIQQVGQIAEQLLGGTGVETLASSFADGVGSIAFRGILCGIEEFMVVLSVRVLHAVYGQKGFVAARAQGITLKVSSRVVVCS